MSNNSSFAPLIYSEALIPEESIRIEGVNRDGYIISYAPSGHYLLQNRGAKLE